jgi:hypothetical protein
MSKKPIFFSKSCAFLIILLPFCSPAYKKIYIPRVFDKSEFLGRSQVTASPNFAWKPNSSILSATNTQKVVKNKTIVAHYMKTHHDEELRRLCFGSVKMHLRTVVHTYFRRVVPLRTKQVETLLSTCDLNTYRCANFKSIILLKRLL